MRLFMFEQNGLRGLALAEGRNFRGLSSAEPDYPGDLDHLFSAGADLKEVTGRLARAPQLDPAAIAFLPPLMRPGKIICLGMNYHDHVQEFKRLAPARPELFARFATTLTGHLKPIIKPLASDQLDYEGEMAAVIGRPGRHISRERALEHVAAYSIFNEASVRDFQMRGLQWTPGKNFDATGAFGPWLVSADELPPGGRGLQIGTRLNGQVMQAANTEDMIFDLPGQIAYISEIMTLLPGDVLVTGTPGGVGFGRDPKVFLRPGDICEIEIEGIGILRNPVEEEKLA